MGDIWKSLEPPSPLVGPPLPKFLDPYLPWKGDWPWVKTNVVTPGATLVSIAVTPSSPANLIVGSTLQFKATGTYSDGSTADITNQLLWNSSNDSIAIFEITNTGLVTAMAGGTVNIIAGTPGVMGANNIASPPVSLTVVAHSTPIPGGAASFTIQVINLPAGAAGFDCSFQDPSTGKWYSATNAWTPGKPIPANGIVCFSPSDSAQFSVPVSTGVLSIFAPEAGGGQSGGAISIPPILAGYQINISVVDGGTYTFDFETQSFN